MMEIAVALIFWAAVNTAGTWMVCKHFHDKTLKAVALNRYQGGLITAADLPPMPDMGHYRESEDPPTYRPASPRPPVAPGTAAYEEIFKSVRGKC
jgi:hypothetical protein